MLNKIKCFFAGHRWYEDQCNYPSISIAGNELELKGINHICMRCDRLSKTEIIFNMVNSSFKTTHDHHYDLLKITQEKIANKNPSIELNNLTANADGCVFDGGNINIGQSKTS